MNFGERRAKRPVVVDPPSAIVPPHRMPGWLQGPARWRPPEHGGTPLAQKILQRWERRKKIAEDQTSPGNLDVPEYRYWIGGEEKVSVFARCRACRKVTTSRKERETHHKQFKCSVWVEAAIKRLQQERKCVVCETKVNRGERWGIPLCSDSCVAAWMFSNNPHPTWVRALAVAKPQVEDRMKRAETEWNAEHGTAKDAVKDCGGGG